MLSRIFFNSFPIWLVFVFYSSLFKRFSCLIESVSSLLLFYAYIFSWQFEFCSLHRSFIKEEFIEKKLFEKTKLTNGK